MNKFRKKPVVIEAEQLVAGMQGDLLSRAIVEGKARTCEDDTVLIETLEGVMIGRPGDWLICGIKGEFYPCKPDIFTKTYEPANAALEPSPKVAATNAACDVLAERAALAEAQAEVARLRADKLQARVAPWMQACFGPEVSADRLERGDRFLEEALELLQSGGYPPERVAALTDYVFSREVGDPEQEVGGVMITLAAYCLAHGLDMHQAGEAELARIWTKVERIRAKQAAKPKGSALPVATSATTAEAPPQHSIKDQWRADIGREVCIAIRALIGGDGNGV